MSDVNVDVRGFAKLKKFQKKFGSGWVGPGPIWIKKKWKIVQKESFASVQFAPAWRCMWRLKVCMHAAFYPVFCDFVIVLRFG